MILSHLCTLQELHVYERKLSRSWILRQAPLPILPPSLIFIRGTCPSISHAMDRSPVNTGRRTRGLRSLKILIVHCAWNERGLATSDGGWKPRTWESSG